MMSQAANNGSSTNRRVDWEGRACANSILSLLNPDILAEILDNASLIYFRRGVRLDYWLNRGNSIFPLSGIHGGVLETEEGECIQPVFVGSEGVIGGMRAVHGLPYFLSFKVRLPGDAIVVSSQVLRRIASQEDSLRMALARVTDHSYRLSALHAACARFHSLSTRCCAWLSLIHRVTDDDVVPITHEELAEVVGATRPAVSAALSLMTQQGLICSIRRGAIHLIDPEQVAGHACDCWTTPDPVIVSSSASTLAS
jgi:CRP-like cAMP-binding protein